MGPEENDRSVSILRVISNIFEKVLCKQLTVFAAQSLSKYQCSFSKGYCAENLLVPILEKRKGVIDNKKVFGAFLADISKAFDCLSLELIFVYNNIYYLL